MAIEPHDGKDTELDGPADEVGADGSGDPTRRRKLRAMRVPSDDVPRPTPRVMSSTPPSPSDGEPDHLVHVEGEIEFDVDVDPLDAVDEGGNGHGHGLGIDVDLAETDVEAARSTDRSPSIAHASSPPVSTSSASASTSAPVAASDSDSASVSEPVAVSVAESDSVAGGEPLSDTVFAVSDSVPFAVVSADLEPVAEAADSEPETVPSPSPPPPPPSPETVAAIAAAMGTDSAADELELSQLELEEEEQEQAELDAPAPSSPPPARPPAPPPAPAVASAATSKPQPGGGPPRPPPPKLAVAAAAAISEPRPKRRKSRAWFEEIFDEDYLRTLPFLTPQTTQREAAFIIEGLGIKPGHHVLDIGCGYGRHAMELAARGFHVLALDLSLPLLLRGADEAQRRGLNINFVHGDMRELHYDSQFDGAYCVFSTFGFFDDDANKRVAQGLARALKPGGRLVLDILNRDYIIADLPTRVWWEGDGCVVLEEVDFNYFNSRILSQRQIVFEDGHQLEQEISIRAYSLHEVGKLLHGAGFRVLQVSGGMAARGRFFGKDSRQIIVVAEKRQDGGAGGQGAAPASANPSGMDSQAPSSK